MKSPARKTTRLPQNQPLSHQGLAATGQGELSGVYGREFWFAYLSNTSMMVAISLLFRYADFVKVGGGSEGDLGWIVAAGMVGSLVMRWAQAVGIDSLGPRSIWFLSALGFAAGSLAHLWIESARGPAVYAAQVVLRTSIAGVFGASITFISSRVPVVRVAEVIGMLGTSGFVGMMGGTLLGDWVFGPEPSTRAEVNRMFLIAAALGLVTCVASLLATAGAGNGRRRRVPPLTGLVRRYRPGLPLLGVALGVGIGVGLPHNYLRPYTQTLGIPGIMVFFWVYAPVALVTRLLTRRWPSQFGLRRMIVLGFACLGASTLLYLVVDSRWWLVVPAVFAGMGHAFLFPSVTAAGATCFPRRYRGLGVTMMLSMYDLGNLVGAPLAGTLVELGRWAGWPPYPVAFVVIALLLGVLAAAFVTSRFPNYPSPRPRRRRRRSKRAVPGQALPGGSSAPRQPSPRLVHPARE